MGSQNISTAVMQRRALDAPNDFDYFPTPPWATRALCRFLEGRTGAIAPFSSYVLQAQTVWEPACGEGHMVRPLAEYFRTVSASDVFDYGCGYAVRDFLFDKAAHQTHDWVITNPPFVLGREFIQTALTIARHGVAMLVRTAFTEGGQRHREIYAPTPPTFVLQFVERVPMLRGRLIQSGAMDPFAVDKDGNPAPRPATSATAYAWLVWLRDHTDTRYRWLAEPRTALERPGDYPAYTEQWAAIEAQAALAAPTLFGVETSKGTPDGKE